MKNPIQPKKQQPEQEQQPKTPQVTQQKKANLANPFLPNGNGQGKPTPFMGGKTAVNTTQMKTANNAVVQRAGTKNVKKSKPLMQGNDNFYKLRGTSEMGSTEGEKSGAGDAMDYAEGMMGDFNDGLGAMADHNDTQSLIAKTNIANEKGVGLDDLTKDDEDNAETGQETTFKGQDTLGGITGTVGGLLTMGSAIKAWGDSEDNWDKAGAVLQGAGGAADVVSNVAGMFGADKISAIADSVSAGIGAVKSTLEVIKGLSELKSFEGDKKEKGMEIAKNATEGVKKGFEATKKMMQAMGSIAPSAVTKAIPVLSIVFSVIEIIQEAMSLIEAVKNYRAMSEEKNALKNDEDSKHFTKKEKRGFIGFRKEKQVTDKDKLAGAVSGAGLAGLSVKDQARVSGKAKDFEMVRSLKKINKERIVRSSTNIALNVVGIIGDIVTLTGAGAPVGIIIKSSAGLIKGGLKMFRGAKQLYNNIKGNENSSENQHKARMTQIKYIFSLVKTMSNFERTNTDRPKANAMADKIGKYIGAMGTSVDDFVKYKNDPDKAIKLLYSALKKREAGDDVKA